MNQKECHYLTDCLYFTANSLSRYMSVMARGELDKVGLEPSYADLLLVVCEDPGLSQNDLGRIMNLTPSTITRFLDKMIAMGLVKKEMEGRTSYVFPTEDGEKKREPIKQALSSLHEKYCEILGKGVAEKLTRDINKANMKLDW